MPELLEHFMQEQDAEERWITVQELRDRFGLTRYQGNTVSGFLRRLHAGTFGQFPYIVLRIEPAEGVTLSGPPKCRYLVKRKHLSPAVPEMMDRAGVRGQLKAGSRGSG